MNLVQTQVALRLWLDKPAKGYVFVAMDLFILPFGMSI